MSETDAVQQARDPVHVIGIGASAGGIRAMQALFAHVPPEMDAAFVVVLHLSPDHESQLAEVLQRASPFPVTQVTERTAIERRHVYVIPPNRSLEVLDGHLVLKQLAGDKQRRAPIDLFFRTLADSHGSRAVCAVLSGTGTDGAAGLKRVKEYGGLAVVQDPAEAEYPDMPRASMATGLVDYVLPVVEMPERIARYLETLGLDADTVPCADDPEAIREVLKTLRVRTGHDFSNYKTATLHRRVHRRVTLRGLPDVAAYARLLRQEPNEAVALMKELLISVTSFFRDPAAWQALEERVITALFLNRTSQDEVRVWVPGCATGEEAYTVAMLLVERAAALAEQPAIQVFATDLDDAAIASAREGCYTEADVADLSDERLQRFFTREAGGFRVKRELRERVLFASHNLVKDPPFSHLDLISCRNLLIYLNRAIQERVLETFHFALRPGGFLFLGASESAEGAGNFFIRLDGAAHIYESRNTTSRIGVPLHDTFLPAPLPAVRAPEPRAADRISPSVLHHRLLEAYAPPSLVATENHEVVHMSERVGRYLQVPPGEPSRDLLTLVRPEIRPDLRTALHRAATERTAVDVYDVLVGLPDGDRRVHVSVRPVLRETDPARGFFLVTFDERATQLAREPTLSLTSPAEPIAAQLEEELTRLKAQLRNTIEQYETQAEESKASNEELQAMNEELRSAAEELETSKEELQSVNEELTTVNQELKIKIEELRLMNNDFQNFINATDTGSIFLDRQLRVKFSTAPARAIFNLLESDVGRHLSDITSHLKSADIHHDVRTVLDRLQRIEREVETTDGRWHLMRLLPYRTSDNRIDGVVLTFQDITSRHQAEQQVRLSEERLRLLIDGAIDYAIVTLDEDGRIDSWNTGAERLFGYRAGDAVGAGIDLLFTPEDRAAGVPAAELEAARRTGRSMDERYHLRRDGSRFYCSGVTTRLGGGGMGYAKIARDLTSQRESADALAAMRDSLSDRVQERTTQLEAEVRQHEAAKTEIRNLLLRLVNAQEAERARIARDLHDHLGQEITTLRLAIERLGDSALASSTPAPDLSQALALTEQIGRDLDFLAWELRPGVLDEIGLRAALPRFVTEWAAAVGVQAAVDVTRYEPGTLAQTGEVAFYRIAQEALNNVSKHAQASRVDVVLTTGGGMVTLVVEDDGVGFRVDAQAPTSRFGLVSMRERAALVGAELDIESAPGRGTSVYLRAGASAGLGALP